MEEVDQKGRKLSLYFFVSQFQLTIVNLLNSPVSIIDLNPRKSFSSLKYFNNINSVVDVEDTSFLPFIPPSIHPTIQFLAVTTEIKIVPAKLELLYRYLLLLVGSSLPLEIHDI